MIWAMLGALALDSVTVCVHDAALDTPLIGVQAVSAQRRVVVFKQACARLAEGSWTLRRIGYRAKRVVISVSDSSLLIRLQPSGRIVEFDTTYVRARRPSMTESGIARTSASIGVDSAREMGISSIAGLVGALPFASARGARGDVGLSLRGARREAVVITLDGMTLNDPSTGVADISDVPLALLGSASVVLGANPIGAGPGANGGVLALQSAPKQSLSLGAASFGAQRVEGALHGSVASTMVAASGSYVAATNDFTFVNDAAGDGARRERRVNNDERRGALTLAASTDRLQSLILVSANERGMVGPANVRTYDADRSRTLRLLSRAQFASRGTSIAAGVRVLSLDYRDPTRPALDSDAETVAGDLDATGALRGLDWRVGAGADRMTGTGNLHQSRGRAFLAASRRGVIDRTGFALGARVDAVGAFGALPSYSVEARRDFVNGRGRMLTAGARLSQAVRVPTLYDLYFSSPQRLFVRQLRPERVSLDAEFNGGGSVPTPLGVIDAQAALVARDTRDAIVWFPGNFGFSPQNVGIERLRGAEGRMALAPGWGNLSAWITTYRTAIGVGGLSIPTPYVATVAGGGQLAVRAKGFTASTILRANGARPYTAGPRNPDFELPAVALVDAAISRSFAFDAVRALASFSLDNVMDVSWQQVRGFPMPGRSWAITVTFSPSAR